MTPLSRQFDNAQYDPKHRIRGITDFIYYGIDEEERNPFFDIEEGDYSEGDDTPETHWAFEGRKERFV